MNYGKSRLFALAAAHGAALLAVPAVLQAQEVSGQLEEVVVTARQRAENIQDVPVTITAFTATEIRSAGITRPEDFIALTPGVSVVNTAEAGDMQVSIRGINTGRDVEPNFALVVDGVLQTNPNALNQELGDNLRLLGYEVTPDGRLLTLWWQAAGFIAADWSVSVRPTRDGELMFDDGRLLQFDQRHPVHGLYPTSKWTPGEVVRDDFPLALAPGHLANGISIVVYRPVDTGFANLGEVQLPLPP